MTRSSATAEKQRVSYTRLSRLTHWSCTWLSTASVLQLYNRLAKLVSTLSANKPCDIRTFKLNRAFKVIQGHPYWCRQDSRTVCCRNVQLIPTLFLKLTKMWQRKTANSSISMTPLKFEDVPLVPARNAFKYLQMIYTPETTVIDLYFCRW